MDPDPVIDRSALARLERIGGEVLVHDMIVAFLEDAPRRLDSAREGVLHHDLDIAGRATHSLKSTAAIVGAQALRDIADRMEERAEAGDAARVGELLHDLEVSFAVVKDELTAESRRLTREAHRDHR
jgi:HPt (histidine-containing phosphotransfer) domain-containing protein